VRERGAVVASGRRRREGAVPGLALGSRAGGALCYRRVVRGML